jgi:hypothetical protein
MALHWLPSQGGTSDALGRLAQVTQRLARLLTLAFHFGIFFTVVRESATWMRASGSSIES